MQIGRGLWLISTFPSLNVNINKYPAIKRHLLSFGKERLAQDGCQLVGGGRSRKKTPHSWYELQDTCAYHQTFSSDKVIWIQLVDRGRFAYDDSGTFVEASGCMFTGKKIKFLCAFLNSELAHWYIRKTAPTSGMGTSQWKKIYVESIPVFSPTPAIENSLNRLVDEARSVKPFDSKRLSEIEKQVDRIIYESYGIFEEEAAAIGSAIDS